MLDRLIARQDPVQHFARIEIHDIEANGLAQADIPRAFTVSSLVPLGDATG